MLDSAITTDRSESEQQEKINSMPSKYGKRETYRKKLQVTIGQSFLTPDRSEAFDGGASSKPGPSVAIKKKKLLPASKRRRATSRFFVENEDISSDDELNPQVGKK